MATVALSLPSLRLNDDETRLIQFHLERLASFRSRNLTKEAYYEARQKVRQIGIAVPPKLQAVQAVVGWPATAVDVLEERLDWLGWTTDSEEDFGLGDVYLENGLELDAGLGHLDALIYGTSFVIVGSGFDGEPQPLVTIESPFNVTGEWSGRLRRLSSALSVDEKDSTREPQAVTLYLPEGNVSARKRSGVWHLDGDEGRDEHGLGRVTVAQLVNRPRASHPGGRSEITRPVRSYTDTAVRTVLGMEIHREFYQAPQRYLLGADASAFTTADGGQATGWEAVMGRFLAIPRDDDGELPSIGQFTASSPAPYLEQVRGLSQLLSAEAAIPANYLGFSTDNPPSADAIRAMEARLVKRAERRQTGFGRAWREVAALCLLVREGAIPDEFRTVSNKWRDPATPTRSAAADEATKLVGAEILPPDSSVTYDRLGFSPSEQRQLKTDARRARALATVTALATPPATTPPAPPAQGVTDDVAG